MKILLLSVVLLFATKALLAQKENNVWISGQYAGLDFGSGNPVVFERTNNSLFWHTTAAICDTAGQLLFYTNGYRIFNRNHAIMANGNNLNIGDYVQWGYNLLGIHDGAAIVPVPEQSGKYYVFHEDLNFCDFDTFPNTLMPTHLFYCLVDMTLDNGNGAVVNGQKDVVLFSDTLVQAGFKVIKHGNGRDYWLLCHEAGSDRFYRFLIDPQGIHGPYDQVIGGVMTGYDSFSKNMLAFSNDGSKAAQLRTIPMEIDLYDFDRCTGQFYNQRTFTVDDSLFYLMGAAFSPNNKYLYVTANYWENLFQFDVSATDVAASRVLVSEYSGATNPNATRYDHLALAPDGKIYINTSDGNYSLHVIHQPDSAGLTCQFEENGLSIHPPGDNWSSVPNIVNYSLGPVYGSGCDTLTSTRPLQQHKLTFGVYPNPFEDRFQISLTGATTRALIEVFDVLGQKVFKSEAEPVNLFFHQAVDLSNYPNGVYLVRVTTNGKRLSKTVVKR